MSNIATFPCDIGEFSGILETDMNARIGPLQLSFERVLTELCAAAESSKAGQRLVLRGSRRLQSGAELRRDPR